jgi:DNA-binding transcriptional regulator YiaG
MSDDARGWSRRETAMTPIRAMRVSAKLSQMAFAIRLGVSPESYRLWDAGRREPPSTVLAKARALACEGPDDRPRGLPELARALGVSVYRLREAANDGRLAVTYGNQVVFGHPVPRATRLAGEAYKRQYYGKKARWTSPPAPPDALPEVPRDYDRRLIELRCGLQLSQAQLATALGAASKAVIYQWESRKRVPSPIFWRKILRLQGLDTAGLPDARSGARVNRQRLLSRIKARTLDQDDSWSRSMVDVRLPRDSHARAWQSAPAPDRNSGGAQRAAGS